MLVFLLNMAGGYRKTIFRNNYKYIHCFCSYDYEKYLWSIKILSVIKFTFIFQVLQTFFIMRNVMYFLLFFIKLEEN